MAKDKISKKKSEEVEKMVDIKQLKEEVDSYINAKKEELTQCAMDKVEEQIDLRISKRMKEEEKKFIRGKNGKIIRRDILILVLFVILGYFAFCLYDIDYFNIRTKVLEYPGNSDENNKMDDTEVVDEKDSTYYIENYSYLVDNLQINDSMIFNLYSKGLTKSNITNELKLKIAYKNMSEDKKVISNNMLTFKSDDLLDAATKIFGNDVNIVNELFTYNNLQFMFHEDTYLGFNVETIDVGLMYQIIDAKKDDDQLVFDVLIARCTSDNKLLNVLGDIVLEDYNDENILDYKDKLSIYQITFIEEDSDYIFSSIK